MRPFLRLTESAFSQAGRSRAPSFRFFDRENSNFI